MVSRAWEKEKDAMTAEVPPKGFAITFYRIIQKTSFVNQGKT